MRIWELRKLMRVWLIGIAVIITVIITPDSKAYAYYLCETNVIIRLFNSENPADYSETVNEALADHNPDDPFAFFARDATTIVLLESKRKLCDRDLPETLITVEILLVELEMIEDASTLDRLRREKIGAKGNYAEVFLDPVNKTAKVTLIWNPRRVLRDQLTLDGWKFTEETPLLPFDETEFFEAMEKYSSQVVGGAFPGGSIGISQLKGTIPDDLLGLFLHNGRNDPRLPISHFILNDTRAIPYESKRGYIAMTVAVIQHIFKNDPSVLPKSVLDLDRGDIRRFYQLWQWRHPVHPVTLEEYRR